MGYFNATNSWTVPDFYKFSRMVKPQWNILVYNLTQLGEASALVYEICPFPLSLIGIAFEWFTSLPTNIIGKQSPLKEKFHERFCNGSNELNCLTWHWISTTVMIWSWTTLKYLEILRTSLVWWLINITTNYPTKNLSVFGRQSNKKSNKQISRQIHI